MDCPGCGAAIADGKRFCIQCGTSLAGRCPSCGAANPAEARFCGDCGAGLTAPGTSRSDTAPLSPTSASGATAPTVGPAQQVGRTSAAERRQLTVLFCDLVGSTALAGRLDPEDMGAVVRAYQAACAGVIARWGGHLAKYLGDGVLAFFGWPQAHEDDAERAVRAGLDLVAQVAGLRDPEGRPLTCRVGIATGLVVVGEVAGEGAAEERAVVGATPNLAARLQTLAAPGQVVIADATRRLAADVFELEDLGAPALKGIDQPVRAFAVIDERAPVVAGAAAAPLEGRAHELGLLLDRWGRAEDGEGQVVLLAGEPGIGKSRMVAALREELADEASLLLFCSPHHTSSPLHPVSDLLGRAAGLDPADSPATRLEKLEALLDAAGVDLTRAVPLLADLLGLDPGERHPPPDLTPQARKARTLATLADWIDGTAAHRPLLVILENAHWLDPSSGELIDLLVARLARLRILLVVTFRPELAPRWAGFAHATSLSLARLGWREAEAIARRLGPALPEAVLAEIVARTDGVPLFVEELTKTVLEAGADGLAPDHRRDPAAIPATLHDALLARLDRLGPAKAVAQTAAVIGREFAHPLLTAIADRAETELTADLDVLVASELVFRRGTPPEASYVFKHALVRDAAYQSLLKSRRRALHARLAEVLEERFPTTADARPEVVAHHHAEAGQAEPAARHWHRAGREAIARSAVAEAVAQLNRGLAALADLPDDSARRRLELDLQTALGSALIAAKGYAADETGRAFARARALCQETGDTHRLMPVLNGLALFHTLRGQADAASRIACEMLDLAERHGDPALLIPAHRAMSMNSVEFGRWGVGREHAEQVLALYEPAHHRALAELYGFDQRTVALGYLARALFALGYPDQARRRMDEAVGEARRLAHMASLVQSLMTACLLCETARDTTARAETAEVLIATAADHDMPHFHAIGRLHRGGTLVAMGKAEEGLIEMMEAEAALRATGTSWRFTLRLAEAHVALGRPVPIEDLRAEVAWLATSPSPWSTASNYWRVGRLLLMLPEADEAEAEACFHRAIEVARDQEAKTWELRAARDLARLWAGQGRRAEARDLLAPVHAWFTEGFDLPDLIEAKALLDELG